MPVGISSAARNLFLLGSSGADVVTNFFKAIDQSASPDDQFVAKGIQYSEYDEKFILGLQAEDGNSKKHGLVEKRDADGVTDWDFEIESTTTDDTILTDIHLDVNGNLLVSGSVGNVPFVSRYSSAGVLDWQSTTNTADVRYNSVTSDSNGKYYACGNTDETNGAAAAFIEKYDAFGTPGWGKSAFILGSDVVLHAIDCNSRGHVVAGGYLQDENNDFKGYFVKLDTTSGQVMWDRTLEITDRNWGTIAAVEINDIMIDGNDFIYIVGSQFNAVSGLSAGYICKYSPEGNMLWQKETPIGAPNSGRWRYNCVEADTATGQIIILGSYFENTSDEYGVLVKYSSDGRKIFTRVIESTEASPPEFGTLSTPRGGMALDASASFYYILFTDQETDPANTIPDKYTYGKVSSSGNGLGAFSYDTGDTNTIEYYIQDLGDRIGRLSDGSVRNDTSDLATNIFNPTKIMFDDLATPVANKKRQMNSADVFQYSGSPAIRPVDFGSMNLLGDTGVDDTVGPTYSNGWAGSINNPTFSFNGDLSNFSGSNGGTFGPFVYTFSTPISGVTLARLRVNLGATSAQVGATTNVIVVDGTDVTQKAKNANAYADVGFQWIDVTTEVGDTWNTFSIQGISGSTNPSIAAVEVNGTILVDDFTSVDGPELIKNGTFNSDVSGWTAETSTIDWVSGRLQTNRSGGSGYTSYQAIPTEIGKRYTVRATVESTGTGGRQDIRVLSDVSTNGGSMLSTNPGNGSNGFTVNVEVHFTAVGTTSYVYTVSDGPGTGFFDNISVKESGIWSDQSGKGNNAIVNGPTYNSGGEYWEFDGTNYRIIFGPKCNELFEDGGEGTIEMWVKLNDISTRQTLCSGYKVGGPTQPDRWDFEIQNGQVQGGFHDNGYASSNPTISGNTWYNFMFVLDKSVGSIGEIRLYINGVEDSNWSGNLTVDRDFATDIEFGIGNRYGQQADFPLNGDIGEVRTYPRALTPAQVFQNYNATKGEYLNEAPDTSPKIGPGIVYGSDLLLNYDFGNRATFDSNAGFVALPFDAVDDDLSEEFIEGPSNNSHYGTAVKLTDSGKMVVAMEYNYFTPVSIYDFRDGSEIFWSRPAGHSPVDEYISAGSGRVAIASVDNSSGVFADYEQKIFVYDEDLSNEVIINNGKNMQVSGPHRIYDGKLYAAGRDDNLTTLIKVYDVYTGTKLDEFSITGYGSTSPRSMAVALDKIAVGLGSGREVVLMDLDGSNQVDVTPAGLNGSNSDYGHYEHSMDIGIGPEGVGKLYVGDGQYNNNAGRVYSWNLDGTASTTIEAPNSEKRFGQSVAVDNGTLVVGSPNNEIWVGSEPGFGNVYVVDSSGSANLTPSVNGADGNEYGCAVDIRKNRVVVGARNYSQFPIGAVYAYKKGFPAPTKVKNLSSNSYPSTISGAEFNSAGYFVFDNANNDEIISSQTTVADTGMPGMTLEIWANLSSSTTFGTDGTSWLFGEEGRYRIVYGTNYLQWVCATTNNSWYSTGTTATTPPNLSILNGWHHIVGVYSGEKVRLVLDGTTQVESSSAISGNVSTGSDPQMSLMGTDAGNVGWGTGSIGEVRIYKTGLTNTEILQNFNASKSKYGV